jgi:hypothetical protein
VGIRSEKQELVSKLMNHCGQRKISRGDCRLGSVSTIQVGNHEGHGTCTIGIENPFVTLYRSNFVNVGVCCVCLCGMRYNLVRG